MNTLLILPKNQDPLIQGFPLGLGYLASALRKEGHYVQCFDENQGEMRLKEVYDLVGVSVTSPTYYSGLRVIKKIKAESPNTLIAVGGPHATIAGGLIREYHPEVDYVFVGESEESMVQFGRYFHNRTLPPKGVIMGNPNKNLNGITHPYRFGDYSLSLFPERTAQMITARGCPYNCSFCSSCALWGVSHKRRSVEDVLSEIEELRGIGYKGIFFEDDEFILKSKNSRKWVSEFTRKAKGLNMKFGCGTRVDSIDDALAKATAESGFKLIYFGLESANQELLDAVNKGTTIEQAERAVQVIKSHGIHAHGSFIIGLPGETKETIAKTMDWIGKLGLDSWTFSVLSIYPGTPLAEKYGVTAESYETLQPNNNPVRELIAESGCVHGTNAIYPPDLAPGLVKWWFEEYSEMIRLHGTCHKKLEVKC